MLIPVLAMSSGCSRAPRGPAIVFVNPFDGIELLLNPAPIRVTAGGLVKGDPSIVRRQNGDIHIAARDLEHGAIWANHYQQSTWKWLGWQKLDGNSKWSPAIAVSGANVVVTAVDQHGGMWSTMVVPGVSNTPWRKLEGIFVGSPVMLRCSDANLWVAGRDAWNHIYITLLDEEGKRLRDWKDSKLLTRDRMTPLCDEGGRLLLVGKDLEGKAGIGRVGLDGIGEWISSGQSADRDVDAAKVGGSIWVSAVDANGKLLLNTVDAATLRDWGSWAQFGSEVASASMAVWKDSPYVFVRAESNTLSWWRGSDGKWRTAINGSHVRGTLQAAPKQVGAGY